MDEFTVVCLVCSLLAGVVVAMALHMDKMTRVINAHTDAIGIQREYIVKWMASVDVMMQEAGMTRSESADVPKN